MRRPSPGRLGIGSFIVVLLVLLAGCAGPASDAPGDGSGSFSSPPPPPPPYPVYNIKTTGDRLHMDGPGVYRAELRLGKAISQLGASHTGGSGAPGSGPQWLLLAPSGTLETANGTASCGPLWGELRLRAMNAPVQDPMQGSWRNQLPAGHWDMVAYIAEAGTITLEFNATPQTTAWKNLTTTFEEWTVQTFNPDIDAPAPPVSPYDADFEQAFSTQAPALFFSWFSMIPRLGTGPRVETWLDSGGTECARDEDAPSGMFPGFQGQQRWTRITAALPTPGQFTWAGNAHLDAATQDPTPMAGGQLLIMTPLAAVNETVPAT